MLDNSLLATLLYIIYCGRLTWLKSRKFIPKCISAVWQMMFINIALKMTLRIFYCLLLKVLSTFLRFSRFPLFLYVFFLFLTYLWTFLSFFSLEWNLDDEVKSCKTIISTIEVGWSIVSKYSCVLAQATTHSTTWDPLPSHCGALTKFCRRKWCQLCHGRTW